MEEKKSDFIFITEVQETTQTISEQTLRSSLEYEKWCEEKGAKLYHKNLIFRKFYEWSLIAPMIWIRKLRLIYTGI